jgi:hypothetical protein
LNLQSQSASTTNKSFQKTRPRFDQVLLVGKEESSQFAPHEYLNRIEQQLQSVEEALRDYKTMTKGLTRDCRQAHTEEASSQKEFDWENLMEAFRFRTRMIQKILTGFKKTDLEVRKYLEPDLSGEFRKLSQTFSLLRSQFLKQNS